MCGEGGRGGGGKGGGGEGGADTQNKQGRHSEVPYTTREGVSSGPDDVCTLVNDNSKRTWQRNSRVAVSVQGDDSALCTTHNTMEERGSMSSEIVG